ncbi:putative plasmid conjugal transfer protein [Burkholderia pseudomallei]|nr:P-type conjugative transfer protein TrbL [Burkholderia pseudomallei]CAJ2828821.1 putative plasmid conjugal transfer protein [Burkholderia pseudomallei]VCP80663.1 putative plasmid conjugal transfer protein [Burkholderia pseudomallei]VCP93057.1 putative plasmid conjugal transfer protein [Burkholderia pseudomallei]VCP94932.1 putative plasmid conjugal transfer protein [Burkholderia pseudomallei]VCP97906.1 putative plasmid conjugal transfer protein [Burkholderia pseudomallei]
MRAMFFKSGKSIALGSMIFLHVATVLAAPMNANVVDSVMGKYQSAASSWGNVMVSYGSWLFWGLALVSMVWTYGMMAMRRADIQEFFAESIRFFGTLGFFWWILYNGPAIGDAIVKSMWMIGAKAIGQATDFTPGGIVQIGYDIFAKALDQSSAWSPIDSVVGLLMALVVMVVLTIVGVNLLLVFVSAWIVIYGGVFFLGFGGSRWTSDIAISFYKHVLAIGAELMVMLLLIGIGKTFINEYYSSMSGGIALKEMAVMLIAAFVLMYLTNKIPARIAGIVGVGGVGSIGGVGVGSLMAAASMTAGAAASAGSVVMAGATSAAGGASALMAAFQGAQQHMAEGTGMFSGSGGGGSGALGGGSGGASSSSGGSGSFGSFMGNTGRFAADMGANLAKGASQVAKDKVMSMMDSAQERVAQTAGGKIASEIRGDSDSRRSAGAETASFSGSTSGSAHQATPMNDEVAAFVNRQPSPDA